MKSACIIFFLGALSMAGAVGTSPLGKVIELLEGLETQVLKEGEEAAKLNTEKEAWCKDTSTSLGFDIKTSTSEVEKLDAKIGKEAAAISRLTEQIEQLGATIAKNDQDLTAATKVRDAEVSDFAAEEKELQETISALQRAISMLEREMAKSSGAALVQVKSAGSVVQALEVMVKASVFSKADASTLSSFIQSQQQADDGDVGAPAGVTYESKSGSIVDVLEDLLDRATAQLSDARKKEVSARHNFAMLKQSLTDEIKFSTKSKDGAQAAMAKSAEEKAAAEGSRASTSKDLEGDKASLAEVTKDCAAYSEEYAAEKESRSEELEAIRVALKTLKEKTAGAGDVAYSFLQTRRGGHSRLQTTADLANFEAVRFVRELAKKTHSASLAQLATRMQSAMRFSAMNGEDPFIKVKGLISDMVAKLEAEAGQDAQHKAYCDSELADASEKKEDKSTLVEKLTTKIGQMSAESTRLKDSVATLQKELAELAASQKKMDAMRAQERDLFANVKKELTEGISGVELAIKTLKEYYSADKDHEANAGAAGGIIGMLEVCMADFTKSLMEATAADDSSQSEYEATSNTNEIEKASKDQDLKYQTKEAAQLDKAVVEATTDRANTQSELDAVMEYLRKLEAMCVAKPETHGQRAERRAAELAGLKEALKIFEGQAFLQRKSLRRARQ